MELVSSEFIRFGVMEEFTVHVFFFAVRFHARCTSLLKAYMVHKFYSSEGDSVCRNLASLFLSSLNAMRFRLA